MATFNKFQDFSEQLVLGIYDFDTNVFKVMLTNVAPVATNTVKANLTEIAAGNGYTAGGNTTTVTVAEVTGTTTVSGTQVVFTAAGGTMATFQYVVLYNDSAASKNLVGWWDNAATVSLADTETFTVKFSNTSPGAIFTLA